MAEKAGSSVGGVIGLLLGIVLAGGIVATPFYIGILQTDQRALDAAVGDDVETIRRVVLNLDEHLGVMSAVYDTLDPEAGPEKGAMGELLARNNKLLDQARSIVRSIAGVSQGMSRATDHLAVNRIEAILFVSAGKISGNRAEFEEYLAGGLRRAAESRARALAELNRKADLLEVRRPTKILSDIEEGAARLEATLGALSGAVAGLSGVIASKEGRVAALEEEAAEARMTIARLDEQVLSFAEYSSVYGELSAAARAAEAEATGLRNGTLAGATPVAGPDHDLSSVSYEGGQPQPGLRDLKFRLEQLEGQVAAIEAMRPGLAEQRATFDRLATDLHTQKSEIIAEAEKVKAAIDDLLARAGRHSESATKAREEALSAFKRAGKHAGLAVTASATRTRDARTALSEMGERADERLERITKDGDTEAALRCLQAEIAYNVAVVSLNSLNAAEAGFDTESFVAAMIGGDSPAGIDDELETIRSQAAEELVLATESLEQARRGISGTNVRASDGTTVSGNNYLWQIDVGQAAIQLLQANLAADRDQRLEALDRADELLRSAIEDREQSPLLTPAINALRYLQRAAGR